METNTVQSVAYSTEQKYPRGARVKTKSAKEIIEAFDRQNMILSREKRGGYYAAFCDTPGMDGVASSGVTIRDRQEIWSVLGRFSDCSFRMRDCAFLTSVEKPTLIEVELKCTDEYQSPRTIYLTEDMLERRE